MSSTDQYTAKSESTNDVTPQHKIDDLNNILKQTKYAMLTTRDAQGCMHSRCMALASHDGLHFSFISDNTSHKQDELNTVDDVNVSFLDPSSTNWVSVCGKARTHQDREQIDKLWSSTASAWFGDLGDGVHKGNKNDPRVCIIEVIPDSIRYWWTTKSKLGQNIDIMASAVTGKVASPGELRTITKDEIRIIEGLNTM
ncbi:hypothetical protein FRC04_004352 [Tulasnella sp. 424]|nr:hypothetical protein FRC04_004352 [Tulasnella sp. 424]KAG8979467.1 hypothetical protein FRC05_008453 [Tulasnella sp. 425]